MSYTPHPQDVRFFNETTVFKSEISVNKVDVGFKLESGDWAPSPARYFVATEPKVVVLPFDPYDNKVIFVENFRIGTLHQPEGPWHLELPTRHTQPQNHLKDVQKALQEEVSTEGLDIEFIGDFYTSSSITTEKVYLYCAGVVCSQIVSQGRIEVLTVQDAKEAVYGNYFRDSSTIIAIHWLIANQQRLQMKWQ